MNDSIRRVTIADKLDVFVRGDGAVFRAGTWKYGWPNQEGYLRLKINGNAYCVHVLIAHAFLGPRPEGLEVDHINRDKRDNHATNLEYVTKKQNTERSWSNRTNRSGRRGKRKVTIEEVQTIIRLFQSGKSKNAIAKEMSLTHGGVRRIIKKQHAN